MALTLKANIMANYKKLGKQPRVFIRIPSANLFLATKTMQTGGNNYNDSIADFDVITQSIDKYGGMAEVSGFGISNLQLGSRFTLCTETALTPKPETYAGAGRLYKETYGSGQYLAGRNATSADYIGSPAVVVGRRYTAGVPIWQTIRSYLQFSIPAGLTSCEEATIEMTGYNKQTNNVFTIKAALGTWSFLSGTDIYNDFTGWAASGAYSITNLAETWSSTEYLQGAVNKIRLNTAGKAQVVLKSGSTLKIMFLSSLDAAGSPNPTADEYCQFDISGVVLRMRYNTATLDNQDAEVYLAYEPVPSSYTDMQLIWKGVVDDYSLDRSSLNLKLKQNDHKKNLMIPKNIIIIEDFPNCPERNLNKPFPILYGSFVLSGLHKKGTGYFTSEDTSGTSGGDVSYPDCFKGIVVKNTEGERNALFCGHDRQDRGLDTKFLFVWNETLNSFSLLPISATTAYSAAAGYNKELLPFPLTNDFAQSVTEGQYREAVTLIPSSNFSNSATDPEHSYDEDPDNYAILTGHTSHITYYFNNAVNNVHTDFVLTAEFVGGADPTKLWVKTYRNERDDPTDPDNWVATGADLNTWLANGQQALEFFYVDANFNRIPINLANHRFKVYRTDSTGTVRIKNVCALVALDNSEFTEIFSYGNGKADALFQTIENPAEVIESFARDEMSLATAEINTTAFDASVAALSGSKYTFQINDRDGARTLLHNFYRQCKSKGLWDEQDRLSIKTFSALNHFADSGTDVPLRLDIFDSTGTPVNDSVTANPIFDLAIERTSLDEVKNDFILKYRKNYATGDYFETLYMTNGLGVVGDVETNLSDSDLENSQTVAALSALCASSYTKYQTTNALVFEADLIRDITTASRLLQYLTERMWKRRYIVSLTTKTNAIGVELGDFINIRDSRINDLFGETTANLKKWEVIHKATDLNRQQITLKAIEVD